MKIRYVKDEYNNPRGCVVQDGNNFAWSMCHPNDQFNKKLARKIAIARLNTGTRAAPPREIEKLIEYMEYQPPLNT